MKSIFVFLLLCFTVTGHAQEYSCNSFLEFEKEYSTKLPMKIDAVTTLVELSVNCETKIVKYVKHLSVSAEALAKGFAQRKQRQYLNVHCNKQGHASYGWSSIDYVYDKDVSLVMKLEASPHMCRSR